MGFVQAEEVTLPLRFLLKTAHFISFLALVFDIDDVVAGMTRVDIKTASSADISRFNSTKQTTRFFGVIRFALSWFVCSVKGLSYAALACFAVEYITLFMGVTIFQRGINLLNILAHGVGVILMILLQVDNWNLDALIAFFTVFNASPTVLELTSLLFTSSFSYTPY